MRLARFLMVSLVSAGLLTGLAGCPGGNGEPDEKKTQEDEKDKKAANGGKKEKDDGEPKIITKRPPEFDEPEAELPEVKLTDADAEKALVQVGDALPLTSLPDLSGEPKSLSELAGAKGTVVAFVDSVDEVAQLYSEDLLKFLADEILATYGDRGVGAVAVHVGGSPEEAKKLAGVVEAPSLHHLHDADKKVFAQVATENLPRVYLVDPEGKILWFDIEFSQSTRRDLEKAAKYVAGEAADEPPTDEPPADEKPTDEKPTDEPPTDEKPADEKPTDEPPADEKKDAERDG